MTTTNDTQYGTRTLVGSIVVSKDSDNEGGNLTIEGTLTAPNFSIQALTVTTAPTNPNDVANKAYVDQQCVYNLPTASNSTLGGVKVGTGLSINGSGVLSTQTATAASVGVVSVGTGLSMQGVLLNLNIAGSSALGGIKVGSGLTINADGVLSVGDISGTYATQTAFSTLSTTVSGKATKPGIDHTGELVRATSTGDIEASGYVVGYGSGNIPYLSTSSKLPLSTIPALGVSYTTIQNNSILLSEGCCTYKKTINWHTQFTIDCSGITSAQNTLYRFELILTSGSTAYVIEFPNTVTWIGDEPTFTETSHCWRIVFETSNGGSSWLASCNTDYEVA